MIMENSSGFDKNTRRKQILFKYTIFVFIAYSITQVATLVARLLNFSSVRFGEILFVTSFVLGTTVLFLIVVSLKKNITDRFANFVFFGQFVFWLVMYSIWFFTLREIRFMALFFALMALIFQLANTRFYQSVSIVIAATIIHIAGSYVAIFYFGQPGSFAREVFFTCCFLPSALFISNLSEQYSRQRDELKVARRTAEQNYEALQVEIGKVNVINDELKKAVHTIQEMAIRDELTGIYNRRHLMELLEIEKKRADRSGQLFSMIMLDIDHFKRTNDLWGHLAGDRVLRDVADILNTSLRATDFCGRYGGEEFMLVLEKTMRDGAIVYAERARRLIESAIFPDLGDAFQVTVSLGVTEYRLREELSQTISRADEALYRAKSAGRNRIEFIA